jgi:type I restriction-modification system DNA methylase subunit/restriction endonuclease S subunit
MPTYTCDKCARVFKQKSGFDNHKSKKNDCSSQTSIPAIIAKVTEEVKATIRNSTAHEELILPKDQIDRDKVLQKYFEEMHNILWSRAGFEPAKAMEHLTFFFAYRLIEIQADKLNLPAECRWSYLRAQKNDEDMMQTVRKGYASFAKNTITKPFFKQPEINKAEILYDIVKHINKIPDTALFDTDTLGNIFEYAQSWGTSTMGTEGQFFTNRKICKLAFTLSYRIKGNLRRADGSLCTFADWFCGTGGFPSEFVKGVNENLSDVNWDNDKESIYCQDQSVSACMTTLLNLLIMTGTPFSDKKIRQGNSFGEPVIYGQNPPFAGITIDYSFLNPPYGGSKFEYSKKIKGEDGQKTTRYYVNQEIQGIGIEADDKVSAGVQLAMATLSEDSGVCSIVLPQGFFFGASKKCVELRKKIAEEYKIWYVVDIASGSFLNTGTKTSMMVFQKGVGPTEKVSFIGLDEKPLVEATLAELQSKHYSLNYKQYLPQSAVEVEGFEMVKLGNIVSFKAEKSKKDKSLYTYIDIGSVDRGNFKAGDTIAKEDLPGRAQYSVEIGDILLGTVRPNLEHYLLISPQVYKDDLIVSNGFSIMRCNTDKVLPTYLYSILTLPMTTSYLTERATGTTYPVVDDAIIGAMKIPLPSLERQQQIVEAIDGWASLAQHEEQALKILEKQMMFQVKEMGRGQGRVKLGNIVKPSSMKHRSIPDGNKIGKYPLISSALNVEYYMDTFDSEIPSLIFNTINADGNCSVHYYEKFNVTSNTYVLSGENKLTLQYMYYYLKTQPELLKSCFEGTTKKALSRTLLQSLEIPLPPITEQQTLQTDFDEIRHKHAKIATYKAKAQEAIQRLIPGASE